MYAVFAERKKLSFQPTQCNPLALIPWCGFSLFRQSTLWFGLTLDNIVGVTNIFFYPSTVFYLLDAGYLGVQSLEYFNLWLRKTKKSIDQYTRIRYVRSQKRLFKNWVKVPVI